MKSGAKYSKYSDDEWEEGGGRLVNGLIKCDVWYDIYGFRLATLYKRTSIEEREKQMMSSKC